MSRRSQPPHRRAPSPGNGGWSGVRSPCSCRTGRIPWQRCLAPGFLGLPGWGGAGTAKVAVTDLVKPGGARPAATHLSRVYSRADSAGALLLNRCGPRRVAGAQPLPLAARVWRRRAPVGAGRGPEPRARARDSARSSLPPSPRVAAQLSPAVRSALWGAARGPRPRGGGSAWG